MQKACGWECAQKLAEKLRERRDLTERRADLQKSKAKLADLKPLSHWLSLTQDVVNAYVRLRDAHLPCVSCGATSAATWDAGHFYSRGARPNLRFEPLNIAKQCRKCNHYTSADVQDAFRRELKRRIGVKAFNMLKRDHEPRKWTREALEELRAYYRQKIREMERG
jgi:hypothetical protein